jgi:hypothetical protein
LDELSLLRGAQYREGAGGLVILVLVLVSILFVFGWVAINQYLVVMVDE